MTRLFILVGVLGIFGGTIVPNAWAVPTPIFYNSLDSDSAITTADYGLNSQGTIQGAAANHTYVAGASGNAFASNTDTPNAASYARWANNAVTAIFTTAGNWNDANGITVDHYFQGTNGTGDEGMWSMVRRGSVDHYFMTQLKNGKLRIAFSDAVLPTNNQYKFTFDGSICVTGTCSAGNQEKVDGVDFVLVDGVKYHLTTSVKDGVFKVWLDDLDGTDYSNDAPIYENNTAVPGTFNWTLPSSTSAPTLTRQMSIGSRGNPPSNFAGTLLNGHWVDEIKIFNGAYTPAEIAGTTVAGDYNGNSSVDAADYVLWRRTNGETGAGLPADGSGITPGTPDGTVDDYDYDFWRSVFGAPSASTTLNSTAVPEPSIIVLVASGCLALAMRRSRLVVRRRPELGI